MLVLKELGVDVSIYTLDELEAVARFYRSIHDKLKVGQPMWFGNQHYAFIIGCLDAEIEKRCNGRY